MAEECRAGDFLEWLGRDISTARVFGRLDDPAEPTLSAPPLSPEPGADSENVLQSFKLPCPVLCIGGVVMIELLGRVQKQEEDDKYYICICHVEVIGRSLFTTFHG